MSNKDTPSTVPFVDAYDFAKQNGQKVHLENAIHLGQALLGTPFIPFVRVAIYAHLAELCTDLYHQTLDIANLHTAIEHSQKVIFLTPVNHPGRPDRLNNLSFRLGIRYEKEGKSEDCAEAIESSLEALTLAPVDDPNRALYFDNLSLLLSSRFENEGKVEDLTGAIQYGQRGIDLKSNDNLERAEWISRLGDCFYKRYQKEGTLEDLDQTIKYSEEAINSVKSDRAEWFHNLSNYLNTRYLREGNTEDIAQAIKYSQDAIESTNPGNPDRATYLNSLSAHFSARFQKEGQVDDLTQAIETNREAVDLIPATDTHWAGCINNYGAHLHLRYKKMEQLEDINQAITHGEESIRLTPFESADRAVMMNNLSIFLNARYAKEGRPEDLLQAIKYCQKAVCLTSPNDSRRGTYLRDLSTYLTTQYEREGRLEDLTHAFEYSQEAIRLPSDSNTERARRLDRHSHCLNIRYEREDRLSDLIQAIKYSEEAINLTSITTRTRANCINNLGTRFVKLYQRNGRLGDLMQAIEHGQSALRLTPVNDPSRADGLTSLSAYFGILYETNNEIEHLTQAIDYGQEAINLMPESSFYLAGGLNNVSRNLVTRYQRQGKLEDLTLAIEYTRHSSKCLNSPLTDRLRGCQMAIEWLVRARRWQEANKMVDCGLEMLPLLLINLRSKLDQEYMMQYVSGMAAMGCAVSLQCENDGYRAVRVLESSRGAISRLAMDSKANLSSLCLSYPDLAEKFERLRLQVNVPADAAKNTATHISSRASAISELRELISYVRTKKGFEDFQDVPSKEKLLNTSCNQITVLLNTTHFRTDALLIRGKEDIQVLPLRQSINQNAQAYSEQLHNRFGYDGNNWHECNKRMRSFLEWLWDDIVSPILHALDFKPLDILSAYDLPEYLADTARFEKIRHVSGSRGHDTDELRMYQELMTQIPSITSSVSSTKSNQPHLRGCKRVSVPKFSRIHWISVGYMSTFPFHAAGYGSKYPLRNTMSYAISSYASTLTARSHANEKKVKLEPNSSTLLLVTMPKTPNASDLKGVVKEAKIIQDRFKEAADIVPPEFSYAPVKVVLDKLPLYNIVHFACHGYADPKSPFQSGLILCGDQPEKAFDENTRNSKLTVEMISSINTESSQLAYLSACCTAENASSWLMDEGIHLAGGFQLAGFPHVVASLWEANDHLSVAIAERFYRTLFAESDIIGHEKVAYALHDAILAARRICDHEPLSWATSIHFGP